MKINNLTDFYKALINGPYAWPGGYPVYFIMSDGEALAYETAKKEVGRMLYALTVYQNHGYEDSGWRPVGMDINYEDNDLFDAHTGEKIECAYGEDDA